MAVTIEGGNDWLYFDGQYQPIPSMPPEYLQLDYIYLSANGSKDLVSIHPNKDGVDISVYRLLMEGRPNIEVIELDGIVVEQVAMKLGQGCPTMSFKLGPGPAALHLSYGSLERLIISVNGLAYP